jgi:hypothetical protein
MRHSHPYVELCVDADRDGALYIAARVVEQHFVVSNVNADRRQAGQITVERRGQRIPRIGLAQIGADEPGSLRLGEVEICFRSRVMLSLVSARSVIGENAIASTGRWHR